MKRTTQKRIAIVVLAMALITTLLGYDAIFDNNLPPRWIQSTLDW